MTEQGDIKFKNRLVSWIDQRLPVFSYLYKEYSIFPMPKNLNYFWSFGAMATIMLVVMILTGIFLAMQYTPHVDHAFISVERIMRDVNNGWLIRYLHMNGASMFFMVVYVHIFRGMYYGSYKEPRELIWVLGVIIFFLMVATAFMGYVLPWGQMSFWAATVITNLFSAIPLVGDKLVVWLLGGFSVDNPTLNRFFALHYLLPFVIVGVVGLHIVAIHRAKSNNPSGVDPKGVHDTVTFHPYYTLKDSLGVLIFMMVYGFFVFYAPNYMGHPDNYIMAQPLVTPEHIVPEWYFLPFYAILRSITFDFLWMIPAKLGGVIAMVASIGLIAFLPWLDRSPVKSCRYRPVYRWFVIGFVADVILLGYCGSRPAEGVYLIFSQIATFWYFFHLLILTPLIVKLEKPLPVPMSLARAIEDDMKKRKRQ
ncbi:MAG: cytochrome b [Alphaproteobacteria bacterium]